MTNCVIIIICIYIIICLFAIFANGGNIYTESIPFIDDQGTYQIYSLIPLTIFTNIFDKKIYKS